MNLLQQVESGARPRPRRILFYGTRGIGLSTFAAKLPDTVFVPADDGLAHLDCRRFPVPQRFGHVLKALGELHCEPHGYRTVVLDPLDALERLIFDDVRREHGVEHAEAAPFAAGAKLALSRWRELLSALDALRDDLGMTCVLVGHERGERIADASCAAAPVIVQRHVPALEARASALVQSWCDEVLFATCADAAQGGSRVIYTTPARSHVAKNRLGLPPVMPMDARELASRIAVPKHPMCGPVKHNGYH